MNTLVIYPTEISSLGQVILSGERFSLVAAAHPICVGYQLKTSVLGGSRGTARVVSVAANEAILQVETTEPPLPRRPITLVVAVSRPQTIKKVVQAGTLLGITEIIFVRTDFTDPNYLTSRELSDERLKREIILGLEQCGDSIGPEVLVEHNFREVFGRLPPAAVRCFGHTSSSAEGPLGALFVDGPNPERGYGVLAIGPERGWSDREVARFLKEGFRPLSFGPRVLRVDSATYVGVTLLAHYLESI